MYTLRELPVEEWPRVAQLGHFASCGLPNPEFARILVVETEQRQVVGMWFAMNVVHLEGLWVDPGFRGRPGIIRRLLHGMLAFLAENGITRAFTLAIDPVVARLASKAGFQRLPGECFVLVERGVSCQPSPQP